MATVPYFDPRGPFAEGRRARLTINTAWLIKLRWVAAIGQWVTIATVMFLFNVEIRWQPLASIIMLTATSNLFLTYAYQFFRKRELTSLILWESLLFSVMLMDLACLTGMLFFTGGISNPFAVFYMVNLALAAVVLTPQNSWILACFTVICVVALLLASVDQTWITFLQTDLLANSISKNLIFAGTSVALVTCSTVIVYFMTRLNIELTQKEASLRQTELKRAQSEKLQALGTLAAGAAHELSTPLATIAIVAKEVQLELADKQISDELKEDISLIRSELDRCRTILDQMSADAGQATGEPIVSTKSQDLVSETLSRIDASLHARIDISNAAPAVEVEIPLHLAAQSIRALLKNALDASPKHERVTLEITSQDQQLWLRIRDRGSGIPSHILNRIGEPFFTTKPPGSGTGLGYFLANSVIEQLQGELSIESQPNQGTVVTIRLPQSHAKLE